MKKYITTLFFLTVAFISFTACSGSDDVPEPEQQAEVTYTSLTGIWCNGNYFVSFHSSGFYSTYLDNTFIDSGTYTIDENVVTCYNGYFQRNTTFTISTKTDSQLSADITYTNNNGTTRNTSMTFTKSDTTPASRDDELTGKSYTWSSDPFEDVTLSFSTYNSGFKSSSRNDIVPLIFFYIYIDSKSYYQIIYHSSQTTPVEGWNTDYNTVKCMQYTFDSNGEISGHQDVQL